MLGGDLRVFAPEDAPDPAEGTCDATSNRATLIEPFRCIDPRGRLVLLLPFQLGPRMSSHLDLRWAEIGADHPSLGLWAWSPRSNRADPRHQVCRMACGKVSAPCQLIPAQAAFRRRNRCDLGKRQWQGGPNLAIADHRRVPGRAQQTRTSQQSRRRLS